MLRVQDPAASLVLWPVLLVLGLVLSLQPRSPKQPQHQRICLA